MVLCGLRFKKHIIFHILCIIVAPLWSTFLKRTDFYKAHRSEKRGVLWLASYPVRCDWPNTSSVWMKGYALHRIVMPCPSATTKNNKSHYKWGICCIQWDIITDFNDLYCLIFMTYIVNITTSAFVIGETTTNKHYSTLLKTRVWIVSDKFFKQENVLPGESEAPDCPCKVGIASLYRNSLWASQYCRLLSTLAWTFSKIWYSPLGCFLSEFDWSGLIKITMSV